jgi:hypothetical protein
MLFRWAFRLLILLIVLAVAAILLLNPVAREVAEYRLSRRTGLEVKIEKLDIGLINARITIENLVIYNSPEFGGSPMLDLPELHLEYDRDALWSRKIRCRLVRLNMTGGNVVEDKNGRINLEVLAQHLGQTGGGAGGSNRPGAPYQFAGIDVLNLTMGQVNLVSLRDATRNRTVTIDFHDRILTGIKSGKDLQWVYTWILVRNGIDLASKPTANPNDPWQYWREKLEAMAAKQSAKSSP